MSVWLPARPEGTKDNRELSTQRGTDMSFSLSPSQLSKAGSETRFLCRTASGPSVVSQILLIKQACADAAVGGTNTAMQL